MTRRGSLEGKGLTSLHLSLPSQTCPPPPPHPCPQGPAGNERQQDQSGVGSAAIRVLVTVCVFGGGGALLISVHLVSPPLALLPAVPGAPGSPGEPQCCGKPRGFRWGGDFPYQRGQAVTSAAASSSLP